NNLPKPVSWLVADGTHHPDIKPGLYDLVFANILAAPLIEMAQGITETLAINGQLILAGLLNEQAAAVQNAYQANGLKMVRSLQLGDWTILSFCKP
ncbi:Ribosomal protein L11 methyltransferase, partial [hydrothermal vent metagenome]